MLENQVLFPLPGRDTLRIVEVHLRPANRETGALLMDQGIPDVEGVVVVGKRDAVLLDIFRIEAGISRVPSGGVDGQPTGCLDERVAGCRRMRRVETCLLE